MSNLSTIMAYWQGKGLSLVQAAGVAGNWQVESGLDPSAVNPAEGAVGLAQWEGGRGAALQSFAASRGASPTDLQTQLDFAYSEFQGPESGAWRALMASTTATQAADVVDSQYERSAGTSRTQREQEAQKIASGQVPVDPPGGNPVAAVGNALGSVFGSWRTDLLGLVLKLAAAGVAGTLVIVGAYEALHDKGTTA